MEKTLSDAIVTSSVNTHNQMEDKQKINKDNSKGVIIDPVLTYCSSFLKNYSVAEVAEALTQFFTEEIVITARNILREEFTGQLENLDIVKISQRRSSSSRTSFDANARDVTEATYVLINEDERPKFVIDDVNKLPILGPSLATPRNQAESILMLEKKFLSLEMKMAVNDELLRDHDQELMRQKTERNETV